VTLRNFTILTEVSRDLSEWADENTIKVNSEKLYLPKYLKIISREIYLRRFKCLYSLSGSTHKQTL
jgi:hypothetical protein